MTDKIFWISVDLGEDMGAEEMKEIRDFLHHGEQIDKDVIITTSEVKPMDSTERERFLDRLIDVIKTDKGVLNDLF